MTERSEVSRKSEDLGHYLRDFYLRTQQELDALIATAIRTRSLTLRNVLQVGVLASFMTPDAFEERVLADELQISDIVDPYLLGELGRVILLQDILPTDSIFGEKLLMQAHVLGGAESLSARSRRVLIQYYITKGDLERAEDLLDKSPDLDSQFYGYLRAELQNPFISGSQANYSSWLDSFNEIFQRYGLIPVELSSDHCLRPFDRLHAEVPDNEISEKGLPLVSVVVTAYRPDEERLWSSVRSIIEQSWTNLEILIVNDCSGPEFEPIFERMESTDSRVKVINLQKNRGTYAARNIGYAASSGDFIAGQDDDDWSHPQRIEKQMAYMFKHPEAIGCRITAVRCDENLNRVRIGFSPFGQNASSLLIRREGFEEAGGFIEARKAADTEFYLRLKRITGCSIPDLKEPLSVIRILKGSLSRADFAPGWKHSSRRSFRSSYEYWHQYSSSQDLQVAEDRAPIVAIPKRFDAVDTVHLHFDVLVAGDWEGSEHRQQVMIQEVLALVQADYRVAVLHLESGENLRVQEQVSLSDGIQKLINNGIVDEVFYDDELTADLLIVRDPKVLHLLPHEASRINVDTTFIIADQYPCAPSSRNIRYVPQICQSTARSNFGAEPLWLATDRQLQHKLKDYIPSSVLYSGMWPKIVDLQEHWHNRVYYRSIIPVVGRFSDNRPESWPTDREKIEALYPVSAKYDVRMVGQLGYVLGILQIRRIPETWTVYKRTEISAGNFLSSLDYYVYFPKENNDELPTDEILQALSAGVIVILPKKFEGHFGDAALYNMPHEVEGTIRSLHSDFSKYKKQLERTKSVLLKDFSYESLRSLVASFVVRF